MTRYLTPAQYVASDDGMNIANLSPQTLLMTIARAESDIDDFMGFDLAMGGFDPHMTSIQRPWNEQNLRTLAPSHPVPIRQVARYRIQVSNQSTTGAGFFANISRGDCVVNRYVGYVEIVPLQAVTYSLAPVILQLGLRPPIVQMDTEVGWFLPAFGEVLMNPGADGKTYVAVRGFWQPVYTQALASQPWQLPPIPPVIYKNGVPALMASLATPAADPLTGLVAPALVAGTTYTQLAVNALPQAIPAGTIFVVNTGNGGAAVTVTTNAPASVGATALGIASFTPAITYRGGTLLTSGLSINLTEGQVLYTTANAGTDIISADYTYAIPDAIRDAMVLQVSYILGQRALNQQGMQGIEMAKVDDTLVRRHQNRDNMQGLRGSLVMAAGQKLQQYMEIAIA